MKNYFCLRMIAVVLLLLLTGNAFAKSDKLPPGFQALTPEGYTLTSPQTNKQSGYGSVSFSAVKALSGRHSIYSSEYKFELIIMEKARELIKMQAPIYRKQLEQDIQSKLKSRSGDEPDAVVAFDPPQLTKYAWGAGITQRVVHKYIGAGKQPDEIEYQCVYLGLIIDDRAIKKFNLSVSGVETREAADQWAGKAVARVEKTFSNDLEDK
jgi:hypothetical protein